MFRFRGSSCLRVFATVAFAGWEVVGFSTAAHAIITCVAPPVLSDPLVYDGLCPGDSGFPSSLNARGRDVFVKLPTDRACSKYLSIDYARNVRILGGAFIYDDIDDAVVTFRFSSGVAFIDGLFIDVNQRSADAIQVNNYKGTLVVQNTYVKGIGGTLNGIHGDLVQTQGGGPLQELTLQNVTGMTGYQGLFTPYRPGSGDGTHKLTVHRVNVSYDPDFAKSSGAGKPLILLYMGSADDSVDRVPDLGTTLTNVWVDGSYWDFPFTHAVYARPLTGSDGCATFEAKQKIKGRVCDGEPPSGDFASAAKVGLNYDRGKFCRN